MILKIIIGILIVLIIIALILMYKKNTLNIISYRCTTNNIDKGCYKVLKQYKNFDEASYNIGKLNIFIKSVLDYLRLNYVDNIEYRGKRREQIKFLTNNYRPENIIENAPKNNINTSFVENKGQKFAICMREKKTGNNNLHKYDDMQFIMLHEVAHLMTIEYEHTDNFWENFKFICIEAEKTGLYTPVDYSKNPMTYCGVYVSYNPYYDEDLIV